ncbi:MAG: hypothetical protein N3E44_05730, partial [Candidatus Bathyarchaeota archaeon]|nr:hypothetical protein [Candidatus Bathyarchaeota archaeon]
DVMGIYNMIYLVKKGYLPEKIIKETFATILAGIFRSIRFGIREAHGKSNIIQFNYIFKNGGFIFDPSTGKFGINIDNLLLSIEKLLSEILTIEAEGDYDGAALTLRRLFS